MFNPLPPESNPPPPPPGVDETHEENINTEPFDAEMDAEPDDVEIPPLSRPPRWPAVARWARLCRVLAFLSLIGFGWGAASNLYHSLTFEPEFVPFMQQRMTAGWYFLYAVICALLAIVTCLSFLGFAELLHLFISLESSARDRRDRESHSSPVDMDPSA